jgi:hypothetical protein
MRHHLTGGATSWSEQMSNHDFPWIDNDDEDQGTIKPSELLEYN